MRARVERREGCAGSETVKDVRDSAQGLARPAGRPIWCYLWNPNILALVAVTLPRTIRTPPNSAAAPFMRSSVCLLAVALLVLAASARATPATKLGAGKWFDRVLFMLFENHSEQEVIADPNFRCRISPCRSTPIFATNLMSPLPVFPRRITFL